MVSRVTHIESLVEANVAGTQVADTKSQRRLWDLVHNLSRGICGYQARGPKIPSRHAVCRNFGKNFGKDFEKKNWKIFGKIF